MISNGGSAADAASCCEQVLVAQKVTMGVYKGVTTSELDELAAETAASLTATHPDYALVRSTLQNSAPTPLPPSPVDAACAPYMSTVRAPNDSVVPCCAARGAHRRLQPAQEHSEVLQRDVRHVNLTAFTKKRSCTMMRSNTRITLSLVGIKTRWYTFALSAALAQRRRADALQGEAHVRSHECKERRGCATCL